MRPESTEKFPPLDNGLAIFDRHLLRAVSNCRYDGFGAIGAPVIGKVDPLRGGAENALIPAGTRRLFGEMASSSTGKLWI